MWLYQFSEASQCLVTRVLFHGDLAVLKWLSHAVTRFDESLTAWLTLRLLIHTTRGSVRKITPVGLIDAI